MLVDLGLEALVLPAADVGELDAIGAARGLGRSAIRAPNVRASSTASSIVVSPSGTKGMTSTAPIRGCSPQCSSMSISRTAAATSPSRASDTARAGPASVNTERLWLASLVRSRR
jgi:hypothetical protein